MSNSFQQVLSAGYLKNAYQGPLMTQLNDDCPIYRGCEEGKEKYSGLQVIRAVKVRRNPGIGATSDGGTLPAIGKQTSVQATITAKYHYLRAGITGPMIKASQNDAGSFVRGIAFEIEEGYNDFKSDFNRVCGWDGTGDLALVNTAAVASTSLVVKGRETGDPALRFLDVGVVIDVYSGSTAVAQGIEITAISGTASATTATLTLSSAVTVSANDVLVRSGSFGNEASGLLYSLDGGTSSIYGIDRSLYISFQSNVIDNSGQQMSLDFLQQLFNEAARRGGYNLSAVWSDFNAHRYYQKLLTPDKRYVNTIKGDGGFTDKDKPYLEFNGLPWAPDKDAPQRVFMLPKKHLKKYELAAMEFADETGALLIAQTSADSFELRCRLFAEIFNEKPSAFACGLNYTSP